MSLIKVNWRPGEHQLRSFGIICALVCSVLGGLTLWRSSVFGISLTPGTARTIGYMFWALAATGAVLAWKAPRALSPVYLVLTAISLPIGFVVSYLALAVLFYLIVTPFGIVFRLIGRDPLTRRFDRSARSYWVRRASVNESARYYRQY